MNRTWHSSLPSSLRNADKVPSGAHMHGRVITTDESTFAPDTSPSFISAQSARNLWARGNRHYFSSDNPVELILGKCNSSQ
jgi:hypothetical protein